MRGLRFLPVLAMAACADLSGLTELVVDGSASDANGDVALDDSGTDSGTTQEAGDVVVVMPPYCASLATSAYTFCADFDEGDVTKGFAKGVSAPWSNVTPSAPTLTNVSPVSTPAAGAFVGSSHQALGYTTMTSNTTGGTISAQVRIDAAADGSSPIVLVQLASDYTIALALARSGTSTTSVTAEIDELRFTPDGGMLSSTPHGFVDNNNNPDYAVGAWHTFTLTLNAGTLNATFDLGTTSFVVAPTSSADITIAIAYSAAGWSGSFDNVYFKLK